MSLSHAARDSHRNVALAFLAVAFLGGALLPVNTIFTLLRETPIFWRNAGGYPVELRALVLATYYPLLFANLILCGAMTILFQKKCAASGRLSCQWLSIVLLFWSAWFLNAGLLVANNVENLIEGRSLHYHPPAGQL